MQRPNGAVVALYLLLSTLPAQGASQPPPPPDSACLMREGTLLLPEDVFELIDVLYGTFPFEYLNNSDTAPSVEPTADACCSKCESEADCSVWTWCDIATDNCTAWTESYCRQPFQYDWEFGDEFSIDFDRLDLDPEPGSCYLMRIKPEEGRSPEEIFSSFSLGCEGMPWVSGAVISNTNSSSGPGPGAHYEYPPQPPYVI